MNPESQNAAVVIVTMQFRRRLSVPLSSPNEERAGVRSQYSLPDFKPDIATLKTAQKL
jgi:hypothetical protein